MLYQYEAYNKDRMMVRGTIEGVSEENAESILYQAGFERIMRLKKAGTSFDWRKMALGSPQVSRQVLLDFTNELTIMIEAGLSLQKALGQLEKQATDRSMKIIVPRIAADLRAGVALHQALAAHPQVFNQTYISMIESNEKSGTLDSGLRQLSQGLKQQLQTRARIQQALVQPAIVVGLAIAVIFILISFVLPRLTKVFVQFGSSLPASAQILINISDFAAAYKFHVLLIVIVLIGGTVLAARRPAGKRYLDSLLLRMPMIGQIIIWDTTARFCRSASNLLKAGVLLPDAMNIITRGISNTHLREALAEVRSRLVQGQTFSAAVHAGRFFPNFLTEMIAVGESSGTLENSLSTVADYYEAKTSRRIDRLTSLIEPTLIIILASGVGFIAVTMIGTIYSMMNQVK